jgi:hypothetical protein
MVYFTCSDRFSCSNSRSLTHNPNSVSHPVTIPPSPNQQRPSYNPRPLPPSTGGLLAPPTDPRGPPTQCSAAHRGMEPASASNLSTQLPRIEISRCLVYYMWTCLVAEMNAVMIPTTPLPPLRISPPWHRTINTPLPFQTGSIHPISLYYFILLQLRQRCQQTCINPHHRVLRAVEQSPLLAPSLPNGPLRRWMRITSIPTGPDHTHGTVPRLA